MATLVACLSVGKGTWQPVHDLIATKAFEKVVLVASQFAKENYPNKLGAELIVLDPSRPIDENIAFLAAEFKKIPDMEVGLNLISGTGVEHMAVLAALLKCGLGVRLVSVNAGSVHEL
ncbi:MAG: hypothetical protein ABIJ21_08245 [Nanoarchaeota archaeon]